MPILTTSGMCLFKAGKKVDIAFSNVSGSDILVGYISGGEAVFSNTARYDFVGNYSSLNQRTRAILSDGVSSYVGCLLISYDMSQYTSRVEAESMINLLTDDFKRNLDLIKEKKVTDFILSGSSQ